MRIDPEDLRRHYESLSDEGLLDLDPADLAPAGKGIYDQEMARRSLVHSPKREDEEEGYHRRLPVFKAGEDWDVTSKPGVQTDDGPPPAWLEDAACPWSAYIQPNGDYLVTGAEVQTALMEAGIPSHIVVKPPEVETPRSVYCVMVPGDFSSHAYGVVERKVFNRMAIAEWKSQLRAFSDDQLSTLKPEDLWGALLERADSLKQAYLDEIAHRNRQPVPR